MSKNKNEDVIIKYVKPPDVINVCALLVPPH